MKSLHTGFVLCLFIAAGCGDDAPASQPDLAVAPDLKHGGNGNPDLTVPVGADMTDVFPRDLVVVGPDLAPAEDLVAGASCTDNLKNGGESDVDCGGPCVPCDDGKSCARAADCVSLICTNGACVAPSCTDKIKNGSESDVDCGGSCTGCGKGGGCLGGSDCASGVCAGNACADASCTDKIKNGAETDVDCGGTACPKCPSGSTCTASSDCAGNVCTANTCSSASCSDKVKNGGETDVDCGGPCPPCSDGAACSQPADCSSKICTNSVCQKPACKDLNCDTWPDLIFANYVNSSTYGLSSYVYPNKKPGFSNPPRTDLPTRGAYKIHVEDLNADGFPDIIFVNYASAATTFKTDSSIFWGSANGYTATNVALLPTVGATDVAVADLNGDGYKDIVFANSRESNTSFAIDSFIYWGSNKGYSSINRTNLPGLSASGVAISDFNGDGKLDVLLANMRDNAGFNVSSYIYLNQSGTFSTTSRVMLPAVGARGVKVEDLDGDGNKDLVFFPAGDTPTTYNGNCTLYYGGKTGVDTAGRQTFSCPSVLRVEIADLDKDGKMEIVVPVFRSGSAYRTNSFVYWGVNKYDPTRRSELPTGGATAVGIADINNDTRPDLVFANYQETSYTTQSPIYLNSPTGFTSTNVTKVPTYGARDVKAVDLDKDGWIDLVFANYYTGSAWATSSYIYWGSASGYSTGNRASLPTIGAIDIWVAK